MHRITHYHPISIARMIEQSRSCDVSRCYDLLGGIDWRVSLCQLLWLQGRRQATPAFVAGLSSLDSWRTHGRAIDERMMYFVHKR